MTRQELAERSEEFLRRLFGARFAAAPVYLFGSRARGDHRWNSDYDFWLDADIPRAQLSEAREQIEASFVPFKVDIVTTPQLRGRFGEEVRREAVPWF